MAPAAGICSGSWPLEFSQHHQTRRRPASPPARESGRIAARTPPNAGIQTAAWHDQNSGTTKRMPSSNQRGILFVIDSGRSCPAVRAQRKRHSRKRSVSPPSGECNHPVAAFFFGKVKRLVSFLISPLHRIRQFGGHRGHPEACGHFKRPAFAAERVPPDG